MSAAARIVLALIGVACLIGPAIVAWLDGYLHGDADESSLIDWVMSKRFDQIEQMRGLEPLGFLLIGVSVVAP